MSDDTSRASPLSSMIESAVLAGPDSPIGAPVHALFALVARTVPDRVALSWRGSEVTYSELGAAVTRLASRLKGAGIGPESLVGVFLWPCPELIAALLAVLSAGAAYVPLDPAFPPQRLRFMADDARLALVITNESLRNHCPCDVPVLSVDDASAATALDLGSAPAVDPAALAYVLFTSGSTGLPKGVEIPHRSLANCVAGFARLVEVTPDDIFALATTISFDIAALEVFLPLTIGARLVILDRTDAADPVRLARALDGHGVTVFQATPTVWRMLLGMGWRGRPRSTALCGGEPLDPALASRLLAACGAAWNVYGPTETTIWSSADRLSAEELATGLISIGRPIDNTHFIVQDEHGRPVPIGGEGELFIGGVGVARGYRFRPELTAARFVPDRTPRNTRGGRLYATGDRVRRLGDGRLQHLGRLDDQIKLRGHRIELGEIESVLREGGAVDAGVVVRGVAGEDALIAYVVLAGTGEGGDRDDDAVEGLAGWLAHRLPAWMRPAQIVALPSLPRTPNGKLDRAALKDLERSSPVRGGARPDGPLEKLLAFAWEEVLDRRPVSADVSFLDLGGHSVLAARIAAWIGELLDCELDLVAFLERPTIRQIAAELFVKGGQAIARRAELALEIVTMSESEIAAEIAAAGDDRGHADP